MINSQQFIKLLLAACPTAHAEWQEHLKDWDEDEAHTYIDVAVFARHMVKCYMRSETVEFSAAFHCTEQCLNECDEDAQGLVIVGFLESLQNNASHQTFGYLVFEHWLGPKSLAAWHGLEEFWEGRSSLADAIRMERQG